MLRNMVGIAFGLSLSFGGLACAQSATANFAGHWTNDPTKSRNAMHVAAALSSIAPAHIVTAYGANDLRNDPTKSRDSVRVVPGDVAE